MKWITAAWALVRDVALTGLGVYLIVVQSLSAHPSDVLLAVALGLVSPAIYEHGKAVLGAPGGVSSSPSPSVSPPPPSPRPPSSPSGEE